MNRARVRRLATIAGRVLAVVACGFVAVAVARQWHVIGDRNLPATVWAEVAALAVGYGFLLLIVGEAWHRLISDFARRPLPRRLTIASYALSQLGKYVPGNIFAYVGRHAYMVRGGVANAALLKAVSWEIVFLLGAATLVATVTFSLFPMSIAFLPADALRIAALVAAGGAVVTGIGLLASPRFARVVGDVRPRLETALAVVLLLVLFFTGQALMFAALGSGIEGRMIYPLMTVAIVSWVVGFVPLGTPAGLGTREATILLLAGPLTGQADALVLAACFRFLTIVGDIVCFAIGSLISRAPAPPEPTAGLHPASRAGE